MAKIERRGVALYINDKEIKSDMKSIRTEFYKANAELNKMTIGSEQYNRQLAKVSQLKGMMDKHNSTIRETSKQWNDTGKSMEKNKGILGGVLNTAKGLLPAFGFGAIIAAGKAAFGQIVKATDTLGTKWDTFTGGLRSGVNEFWRTIAAGDWSNFTDNMKEAIRTGREYQIVLDQLQAKNRALSLAESDAVQKQLELEDTVRNSSLSPDVRIAAAKERIKIEEDLAEKRSNIAKQTFENELMITSQQSRLSKDQLMAVIKDLDSETKAKAEAYNVQIDEIKKLERAQRQASISPEGVYIPTSDSPQLIQLKKETEAVSDTVKTYAQALTGIGTTTDEQLDRLVETYGQMKSAEVSALENTRRVRSTMYSEIDQLNKENEKKQQEDYKKHIENLKQSLEDEFSGKETILKEQRAKEEITQEQFQNRMKLLELAHMEAQKVFLQENGDNTVEIESKIADKKIEIINERIKQEESIEKEAEQKQKERLEKLKSDFEEIKKLFGDKYSDPKSETAPGQIKSLKKIGEGYDEQMNRELDILKNEENALVNSEYFKTLTVEEQEAERTKIMKRESEIRQGFHDKFMEDAKEQAEIWMDIGGQVGTMFGEMLTDQETSLKEFGKNVLILALDILEKQLEIAIASATIQSLATPDSVMSFGVSGIARGAILTGLMKAAFAALKGAIKGFSEGGYTGPGGILQPKGVVHAGEYVVPNRLMQNPVVANMTQTIEALRTRNVNVNPNLAKYASGGFVDASNIGLKYHGTFVSESEMRERDRVIKELATSVNKLYQAVELQSKTKHFISVTDVKKALDNQAHRESRMGM